MKTTLLAFCTAAILSGCVIHVGGGGNSPDQHSTKRFELEASALTQLVASTGAGSLLIQGEAGRTTIEVVAEIHSYDGMNADISLQAQGNNAQLHASLPSSFVNGNSPYIDLIVKVPTNFGLVLDDGSGDTVIEGLTGALHVTDGSGELRINGGNSLRLDDGSGDVFVRNIAGAVSVEDGSGDLEIDQIGGIVSINDGSGDISVVRTAGLTITDAGSGDLDLDQINGPVSIAKD
ncbi:hypothetical protein EOE67_06070 [Rheinheimera riviphila]|uniref:DUF4097 domain-containing protein n=1 Tax=Rheinheimera riviphila TaxID=1834037 RepID=A0A437R1M8_9GAMM|nr:hypothetical protein [Rheinheimera riviphila]RVU40607.1 hypothetical protein EOE67_06070 [Rheinheimera riviphila]